jgi:kynurenine formamidase
LTVTHLGAARDAIKPGDRVLLRTDWSHRHGTAAWRDELPRVGDGLAQWLVDRGVVLLGVEPPSVADVHNHQELTLVHRILLEAGIVIVEGLTNLDRLTCSMVELIVLPLKVRGGDGAPARAIAIEPQAELTRNE